MSEDIKRYDDRGNCIYWKISNDDWDEGGEETWYEYDERNNLSCIRHYNGTDAKYKYDKNDKMVYYKSSNGVEVWWEYNKNGKLIYRRDSCGNENWWVYDKEDKRKDITEQKIKEREQKEFLSREEIPRFELMEI
jgi:YD repeat-containing protein